jgi:putative transposase
MCHVLKLTRSGYYAWLRQPDSARAIAQAGLLKQIEQFYIQSGKVYGSPRVYRDCKAVGLVCSENLVARLMRHAKLQAVRGYRKARFKAGKASVVSENLLKQDFTVKAQNVVWVTDITQLYTHEGWLYIAVVIDLYSRMVVGWSMQSHSRTELVLEALLMAKLRRHPTGCRQHGHPAFLKADQGNP